MTGTTGLHLDARPPYVRGFYGRTYDVSGGVKAVDKFLHQLAQIGARPDNEDYDLLLDARAVLVARERKEPA